jgi:formylglycine-generating enzyme required for sulfatase activity
MAVGSRPAGCSPYGVLDVIGNVEEWVFDRYSRTYYSESPHENPLGPEDGFGRVIRGDSYMVNIGFVNLGGIVTRMYEIHEFRFRDLGIRCCRSVPAS